jgi:hypothetical protein
MPPPQDFASDRDPQGPRPEGGSVGA